MLKKKLALWLSVLSGLALFIGWSNQTVHAESINDYIERNNIQPSNIQQVNGTFDQWFGYENGVGKPEGVVIHETATPGATAWDEVTYFNREWQNAQTYVHAFADANHILQIHSTDYGVWGAGYWANQRFIQIELCEESTYDGFVRSVNNQAYFTAYMLNKYGLKPSLADDTGSGTIWSHNAVNKYHPSAGGHTDPIGWFNQWGYTMWQFYQLVQYHYNKLNGAGNTTNDLGEDPSKYGVVQVNSDVNFTPVYVKDSNGNFKEEPARVLPADTQWKYGAHQQSQGHTYYRVATKEWAIDSSVHIITPSQY
ncbi:peptidoglycan recognition protein family protein [Bombilactobacillus folatiphilus]|uniref:Peptidoglycan recognition protein family protein n=1 Tax=Bombilactobacillus folatiphilus TaxID=2923362 RepID=A0ABY4P8V0_9LACO|nr:peptidoglycan recognition family protein [Bombilactobacillus folatiphilus]UQS81946.1 peptidoglycan recognition protein family protein [Bombilactobacillus folatiphilus]